MSALLLDTTVIIDVLRGFAATERWLLRQRMSELSLSAITLGELLQGIHHQHRQDRASLARALECLRKEMLAPFQGRILAFDAACAEIWGRIIGEGAAAGRAPSTDDAKVAAIALRHGLTVVTSNTRHFAGLVPVVDPRNA
jgi:predicted nucleic acid-binding protein